VPRFFAFAGIATAVGAALTFVVTCPAEAQTGGVFYKNCAAARAAGAAPIRRGQPGYGSHLDRDGDGIACEPYRGNRAASSPVVRRRPR
jgi:hypothetical protein